MLVEIDDTARGQRQRGQYRDVHDGQSRAVTTEQQEVTGVCRNSAADLLHAVQHLAANDARYLATLKFDLRRFQTEAARALCGPRARRPFTR